MSSTKGLKDLRKQTKTYLKLIKNDSETFCKETDSKVEKLIRQIEKWTEQKDELLRQKDEVLASNKQVNSDKFLSSVVVSLKMGRSGSALGYKYEYEHVALV